MSESEQYIERWNPIGATLDDGDWYVLFARFNQGDWEFCQVAMAWEHIGTFENPGAFLRSMDTGTDY